MLNRKIIFIELLLIFSLAISTVSAEDNLTEELVLEDNNMDNYEDLNLTSSSTGTFTDLNNLISTSTSNDIYLTEDYKFSPASDSAYVNGIVISKSINIFGGGHTLDGNYQARIFNLTNYVGINGVNFINGNSQSGSAVTGTNFHVTNCTFSDNYANNDGGAVYNGYADNCTFISNSANNHGGAMCGGAVNNCVFINNNANYGGAIYEVIATYSLFEENFAYQSGGAISGSSARSCTFISNSAKSHSGAATNCYVVNCTFKNNTANQGGALGFNEKSSADSCIFEDNYADTGGAIYGCYAVRCTFNNNYANQGGAMAGICSAVSCLFVNNHAVNAGGALLEAEAHSSNFTGNYANQGGAMYHNSATDCRFISNSAFQGGALFGSYAKNCLFEGNRANQGGAICDGSATSSTFNANHAVNGGAMYGGSQEGSAQACIFKSNSADEYGGALYATSVWNSYFEANTANYGGAMAGESSASGSTFVQNVAKISGGVKHNSYVGGSNFSGNLPAFKLGVSDYSFIQGFGGDINIKLYDSPQNYVVGENLTVKVYNSKNQLIGTYNVLSGYNWFTNFASGKYRAIISVDDSLYEVSPVTISITVKKSTSIYVTGVTANYDSGKCMLVNLHDSAGNLLKFTKVSINLNGATKSYVTDDNGQVILSTDGLIPKTYTATITYAGDNNYMPSSASAKIIINKVSAKLTAGAKSFKLKDKTKKYVVTLKNHKNAVMKNAKVTVKVNGKTYSAKTNSKGQAIFKLKKLKKKGTYSAVVNYGGSSIYNSLSKKVKIKVKK